MAPLTFVTGNSHKFEVGKKNLEKAGINLVQEKLETPEIQSADVSEIAKYSARWAAEKLNKPVILTDAGYFIESLNGFPGPFIKYVNHWLTADNLLRLMAGKTNRRVLVKMCLAYCEPGSKPTVFSSEAVGTIADKAGETADAGITPIDQVFIPDGFTKTVSQIPREQMAEFWSKAETYWQKIIDFLANKET